MLRKIFLLIPLILLLSSCTYKKQVNKYRPVFVKKKSNMSKPHKRTEVYYYYKTSDYDLYNLWNWDNKPTEETKEPVETAKKKKKDKYRYCNWR